MKFRAASLIAHDPASLGMGALAATKPFKKFKSNLADWPKRIRVYSSFGFFAAFLPRGNLAVGPSSGGQPPFFFFKIQQVTHLFSFVISLPSVAGNKLSTKGFAECARSVCSRL
jgi:hypothetical protein